MSFQGSVIYCELCDYESTDSEAMMKHMMDSHNEDGDWLCNQCDYQTSRQKLFTNHIDRKHGENDESTKQAKCEFSGISLSSKDIVKEHDNKTYKPCKYFLESECKFGDQCRFSHNQLKKGEFICYVCGQTFNDLGSLMKHRKTDHTSVVCKSFQKGECKFNAKFCWWSHDKVPSTIQSTDFHDVQVFQQDQRNKAPPFREPSLSQSPAGENQSLSSQSTVQPEIRQVTGEEHQAVFFRSAPFNESSAGTGSNMVMQCRKNVPSPGKLTLSVAESKNMKMSMSNQYNPKNLPKKIIEALVLPKVINCNPQSLYNKKDEFLTFLEINDIQLAHISESWDREKWPISDLLKDLERKNFTIIANVHQRKGRGGRPILIVKNDNFEILGGLKLFGAALPPKMLTMTQKFRR